MIIMNMKITKATTLKPKPKDESKLGFGQIFTDHMLVHPYSASKGGWHSPEIKPYGPLNLDPAACGLHYGQLIFEGLKCYRTAQGKLQMFRPRKNIERMNRSARRLCMPELDVESTLQEMKELLKVEADWVPKTRGTSLYIRPTMIATEPFLGVHPSHELLFYVILCPVGFYYASGFAPVKIFVEDEYVRAAVGGTGEAKAAGNYAASLIAAEKAVKKGFTQVLWLDAAERKYVEEVGTMNMMFKINGEVITPPLGGSILPGVTRDSVLQLLRHWGMKATERRISIDEVVEAAKTGTLEEAFGTGTAAVVTPVGSITFKEDTYTINKNQVGPLTQKLYDELVAIQLSEKPDPFGWVEPVD
jgi:branched-chain amino acid aminotransferase